MWSDMKTTSFLHNLWLGLCKAYLETIFPLCRNHKNKNLRLEPLIGHCVKIETSSVRRIIPTQLD